MKRYVFAVMLALAALAMPAGAARIEHPQGSLIVLCYHDIVDDVRDHDDPYVVSLQLFAKQLSWIKEAGYAPVRLADVIAARSGGKPLPAKAILLTFDDGHRSVYTHVLPLLKLFNYPAVVGLVGRWMDGKPGEIVAYSDHPTPRERFLSWNEVREIMASGLIEIASHSYDLHNGIVGNPQGNTMPAAITRMFDVKTGRYESDDAYHTRIKSDLKRNADLIARETGTRPRAMVWPFGAYSIDAAGIATSLGMQIGMTLDDGVNLPNQPLPTLKRVLISYNTSLSNFIGEFLPSQPSARRVMRVDLDAVFDGDPTMADAKLSQLLDRIDSMKPNIVYLRAFADTDGDGLADALYFPNRHLPTRADLFSRVARQIQTRAGVAVYAWLPIDAFALSVGDTRAMRIREIFEDLGRHAPFAGLLLEEPPQHPRSVTNARIEELGQAVVQHRAPLKLAITTPSNEVEDWMDRLAKASRTAKSGFWVDHVTVRETTNPDTSTAKGSLLERIAARKVVDPETASRVVIELDAAFAPANSNTTIEQGSMRLAKRMRELELGGVLSFGYGPDRPDTDVPRLKIVKPAMSLRTFPLR